jgi:hypothetical protein
MRYFVGLILTVILAVPTAAYAWGATGHAIIAELAQRRIISTGSGALPATALTDLLGPGMSLASFATWADDYSVTAAGKKTRAWHRIPIDLGATEKNWKGDCKDEGDCLPMALAREISILADKGAGRQARILALKFVVNLVGELTDPLNCVARNDDKGDATLKVDFTGEDAAGSPLLGRDGTALHQLVSLRELWDNTLIDNHTSSFGAYVDELEILVPAVTAFTVADANKTIDSIKPWVDDCHKLGVLTYVQLPGASASPMPLGAKYQRFAQPIIEQQLALAASQLASVLNYSLGK